MYHKFTINVHESSGEIATFYYKGIFYYIPVKLWFLETCECNFRGDASVSYPIRKMTTCPLDTGVFYRELSVILTYLFLFGLSALFEEAWFLKIFFDSGLRYNMPNKTEQVSIKLYFRK